MLRRRRPPQDADRPEAPGTDGQERASAQRRRQLPGLALLHHLQGRHRSGIPQPDEVRRDDRRQPRVRRSRRRPCQLPRQGRFPGRHRQCAAEPQVEDRRPDQAVDRARCRRAEDRHRRRSGQRHAGALVGRAGHPHRRGRGNHHQRDRRGQKAGRQQDHRAHPCRLPARPRGDRQDPGRRRGGRRPLPQPAFQHRRKGRRPIPDDGRQSRGLQGAGGTGRLLQQISRRSRGDVRRQRRGQGRQGRPDPRRFPP